MLTIVDELEQMDASVVGIKSQTVIAMLISLILDPETLASMSVTYKFESPSVNSVASLIVARGNQCAMTVCSRPSHVHWGVQYVHICGLYPLWCR